MSDLNLKEVLQYEGAVPNDVADGTKRFIDDKVSQAGKAIYRGMLQVMASGFGKGLLATAAVVVAATTAAFILTGNMPAGVMAEQGLAKAGEFLLNSWGGAGLLTIGGLVGAVAETKGEQNRITADMAEAEARRYELVRGLQKEKTPTPQPFQEAAQENSVDHCGHCAKLLEKRAAELNAVRGGIA